MNRSRREILGDILEVVAKQSIPTRINQTAKLNYAVMKECLVELEKLGMVFWKYGRVYLTQNGYESITVYRGFKELFGR